MLNEYMQKVLDENKSLKKKITGVIDSARIGIRILEQSGRKELIMSRERVIKLLENIIDELEK